MGDCHTPYTLNAVIRQSVAIEVSRGYSDADGTPVVVKALRASHPAPSELNRLRHEFAVLRSLDLPGVVRALDLQPLGHGLALVLEDAGELSLGALIQAGRLDLRRSIELAIAMVKILASLHRAQVIHKDVKPEHFIVRAEQPGQVVLVDFAIATRLSRHTPAVAPVSQLEGTLAYIAPEQTGRMNRIVDHRSDLYSLGVSFYQMFTGHLPFQTTDPLELVHSHIARTPKAPHEVNAAIPRILSDMILKLMAKAAEDRYQSASGLEADLKRCLLDLDSEGRIPAFPLAELDVSSQLSVPQKLYGRQKELQSLLDCFGRVSRGATELLLLSGYSGVGKSALVAELHQKMVRGGYFAAGKFDHLARGIPYAPIVRACRQLTQSILAEAPEALAQHKQALLDALGHNGKLVIDVVPDLEQVIGGQPDTPVLGPTESQHRFDLVLQSFLGVFASADHPLVLFFDDLQWADPASLRLLEVVLTGASRGHIMVIGAYRDNEVDPLHPLILALEHLRKAGVARTHLVLEPLRLAHVTDLLVETLHSNPQRVGPLAEILFSRTQGNAFFLLQLLDSIYKQELLRFNDLSRAWEWDLELVSPSLATDNVIEFLIGRLRELPAPAQRALRLAACIGHEFDEDRLAVVFGATESELRGALAEALKQGLVLPIEGHLPDLANIGPCAEPCQPLPVRYRFLHVRVQQAAYSLISDAEKSEVHLSIGRLLLARCGNEPKDDELFTVVDHLDRGVDHITDPEEVLRLARLNLSAGKKARSAAAPASGVSYLGVALRLLKEEAWTSHYDIAYAAHLAKAECDYLTGNPEEAFRLIREAESRARTVLERVAVRNLKVVLLTNVGGSPEACAEAVGSLRMLGIDVPAPDDKSALGAAIQAEFGAYHRALGGRDIESLAELPPMSDATLLAAMETFTSAVAPAFQCNPELHVALVLKAVALPLRYGTAPASPFFYVQYAIAHMVITGDLATGYRFGRLGLDLCERAKTPALAGPVHFVFGCFASHWREPFSVAMEHFRIGFRLSLELGDYMHAGFSASIGASYQFFVGGTLDEVEAGIPSALQFAKRTDDLVDQQFCQLFLAVVQALRGRTKGLTSLDCEGFEEAPFRDALVPPARPWYLLTRALLHYLSGNYVEALAAGDAFQSGPGMLATPEHAFYRALTLAELVRAAEPEHRQPLLDRMEADARSLKVWADSAPVNYGARFLLVRAELAAIQGDTVEAMRGYDQAITDAEQSGFFQIEAIACEACARFHLRENRVRVGRAYLRDSLYAYQRWGAFAKVEELRKRHSDLIAFSASMPPMASAASTLAGAETTNLVPAGARLDLTTAIREVEALATELSFDKLLHRLMRSLVENAGAQRGFLVLPGEGLLKIEAEITIDPDTVRLHSGGDVQTSEELSRTVVQYVARALEPFVSGEAVRDPRCAVDPYILRVRPKSILAVPMLHRGKLAGVLYLENNTITNAFNPSRMGLLQFLASQAAAAIDNARLYGELEAASEQLRRANETLESQVVARTEELRRALAQLWSEVDLARKIQTVLLPAGPHLPNYDVAATMVPAEQVGGDYYDVIPTGADQGWVLIGDVSGHGVTAGLIMMMVQCAIRTALAGFVGAEQPSPATVLSHVNSSLWNNLQQIGAGDCMGGQYMTITALQLERGRVRYAGLHQDILVYRAASRRLEKIETCGAWIGVLEDLSSALEDHALELEPGDIVLLYTDGLTELPTDEGRMLGADGLVANLQSILARTTDPAAIVKGILGPFAGRGLRDDVTLMAIRHTPMQAVV